MHRPLEPHGNPPETPKRVEFAVPVLPAVATVWRDYVVRLVHIDCYYVLIVVHHCSGLPIGREAASLMSPITVTNLQFLEFVVMEASSMQFLTVYALNHTIYSWV